MQVARVRLPLLGRFCVLLFYARLRLPSIQEIRNYAKKNNNDKHRANDNRHTVVDTILRSCAVIHRFHCLVNMPEVCCNIKHKHIVPCDTCYNKYMKMTRRSKVVLAVIVSCAVALSIAVWWLLQNQNNNQKDTPVQRHESSTPKPNPPSSEQLFSAVNGKRASEVAELVKQGAALNAQDSQGRTPAMVATYNNDFATAKVLIEAGADVNIRDNMLNNPFLYSGAEGYLDILKLTIKAGADPTLLNRYGGTALIPAGEHGHVEVIRELLTTTKIDVNHVNNLGWTALLEAILLNNGGPRQQQAVQLFVDHGANVNLADKNGVTPLQHARAKGFTEIVRILQNAGAR